MSKTAFLYLLLLSTHALARPGDLLLEIPNPNGPNGIGVELFGASLASHGNLLLVGSPGDNFGVKTGSVYLFNVVTGQHLLTIRNPGPSPGAPARFGAAVAFHGQNILVGSPAGGLGSSAGSTYLFDVNTGEELLSLPPTSRQYGSVLTSNGRDIIVGAPDDFSGMGAVYVYDGATGEEQTILRNPLAIPINNLGASLTTIADKIVVGAPGDTGRVFLFSNSGSYALANTIPDPAPSASRYFGAGLDTTDNQILISAPPSSFSAGGAVYLYGLNGKLEHSVIDSDPGFGISFGKDITAVKDSFLVTAPSRIFGSGDSYLFDSGTGNLMHVFPNTISSNSALTGLGDNIAIANPSLVLGRLQTVRIYVGGYHNPEPSSFVLLLTAAGSLALWHFRRHRR